MGFFISEESRDEFVVAETPSAESENGATDGSLIILSGEARLADLSSPASNLVEALAFTVGPAGDQAEVDLRRSSASLQHEGKTTRFELLGSTTEGGGKTTPLSDPDRSFDTGTLNGKDVVSVEIDLKALGVHVERGEAFTFRIVLEDGQTAGERYRVPFLSIPGDEVPLDKA